MSEVKRFDLETDPTECGCGYKYMLELPTGEYVLASDYDALAARVARLEDGLSEALGIVEQRYPDSAALLRREYLPDADGGKHG